MTDVVTTGQWISVNKGLPRLGGLGEDHVKWGIPARGRRQSGYRFAGSKTKLLLDGSEFVIGTFTHNNFPIRSMPANRFVVNLRVSVAVNEGGLKRNFDFAFNHFETPNSRNRLKSADRVGLGTVKATETIEIDGETYNMEIVGFKQDGKVVKEFVSFEKAANSAVIVARLVRLEKPKPEPEPEPEKAPEPEPEPEKAPEPEPEKEPEPEPEPEKEPEPEDPEPEESTTYTFNVLNPDGSIFGRGCFSYAGDDIPVDIAHIMGGGGRGNKLTSFWYHDPLVGTMGIDELLAMNFTHGVEGKPSKFTINAANVPEDSHALAGGIATPEANGCVSVHRNGRDNQGCAGRKISFPTPCRHETTEETETEPVVDLVIVMDSSVSMRPDAIDLSESIEAAIEAAKTKCPSDLEVTFLGIEGRFSKSRFDTTIRQHLTALGVDESEMRGRKRGTVEAGGAQEDGGRAIEDVATHHKWRPDARRSILFLGDEGIEGGDNVDEDDVAATTRAIDVATNAEVRVHTYLADSKAKPAIREANEEAYGRIAKSTGGEYMTSRDTGDGFQPMLEKVLCASRKVVGETDSTPCPCTEKSVQLPCGK